MRILLVIGVLSIVVFCVYQIWPIKIAIKSAELKNLDEPYYLVKWTRTTATTWMLIGDHTGEYAEARYVALQGATPDIVENYDIATGDNVYICYGEYTGEKQTPAMEETLHTYNLTGWDILYPVNRNSVFSFWPKSYLSRMDMNGRS